jgi:hypothetical protein
VRHLHLFSDPVAALSQIHINIIRGSVSEDQMASFIEVYLRRMHDSDEDEDVELGLGDGEDRIYEAAMEWFHLVR